MKNKLERMKHLINQLNEFSKAYYVDDRELIPNKRYDELMDELEQLENETKTIYPNSPLHKVQGEVLDGFKKETHTTPMRSANKTKDINEIKKFVGDNKTLESWKLDGLTIVCRYKNGEFIQAITRGNGYVGEDVTETFKHCSNLPIHLSEDVDVEVRGECVISWEEFNRINDKLENKYKHPRNLAAGTVRNLDTSIVIGRKIEYIVFELIQEEMDQKYDLFDSYEYLKTLGFDVVENVVIPNNKWVDRADEKFEPDTYKYPVDGTIFKYDSYKLSQSLGSTERYPLDMMAKKWADDLYETTLKDIIWNTTKSGTINPVAVFDEVNLDGALTTKATLFNISNIKELKLGIGDTVRVYRANGVIPQIYDSIEQSNSFNIPNVCPICGGDVEVRNDNGTEFLYCLNENCDGKLLSKLSHAVSRNAWNIDGLSEQTIKEFIKQGWLKSLLNIYTTLPKKKIDIMNLEGFGRVSATNLMASIEKSKNMELHNFINGLSIPLIGNKESKTIADCCFRNYEKFGYSNPLTFFIDMGENLPWSSVDGIGEVKSSNIKKYINKHDLELLSLALEVNIIYPSSVAMNKTNKLNGNTFVITGSVEKYKNRKELQATIEDNGGKVTGSVTRKTTYLINNDTTSNSSKNKKAKELGIPIITEEEFINMIK